MISASTFYVTVYIIAAFLSRDLFLNLVLDFGYFY
jgi:hypothetical protein